MKQDVKWYAITEYVDLQTGEKLTSKTVMEHYIILKTNKTTSYEHRYHNGKRYTLVS